MLEPYSQSAILLFTSQTATTLQGSIISFFEINDKPILFSTISHNEFSIYIINPYYSYQSFMEEIPSITSNLPTPLYLFNYDQKCFQKYFVSYGIDFSSHFSNFQQKIIPNDRFSEIEDFFSFTLRECFTSFFNQTMYENFAKTKDPYEIVNFVRSIMFSKLVLTIDTFSIYKFLPIVDKDIIPVIHAKSTCSLPAHTCLIDIETLGLDEYSDIILFSLFRDNSFFSYYLTDTSDEGQRMFREFITYSIQNFDVVYVFNAEFENKFFPDIKKFVDVRFQRYQFWASARRLVHLPYFHLEFDPGSGKNVPIWNKIFLNEKNKTYFELILQRTTTNILTKLAIFASNLKSIPFNDPIVGDVRRIIPPLEFLHELNNERPLLKKKISFYADEFYLIYNKCYKEYSEMYLDNILFEENARLD